MYIYVRLLSKYFVLAVQKFCQPARTWDPGRSTTTRASPHIFVMQKVFTICKAASWVLLHACPVNGTLSDCGVWPNRFLLILGILLERRSAKGFYTCCRFYLSAFTVACFRYYYFLPVAMDCLKTALLKVRRMQKGYVEIA